MVRSPTAPKHLSGLGPSPLTARIDLHQSILQADQAFVHVENNAVDMERKMTFQQGVSGNPHGNRHHTRHLLNQEFIQALLLRFREHGKKAIEKVAREQPASYLKILALLVPREHKVENSNVIKSLSDQELEAMIEYLKTSLEAQARSSVGVIEGTIEPAAATAHAPEPKNRLMLEADTAVGPRERIPRKMRPPAGE